MIYCFDIDGTICTENSAHDYSKAKPKTHIINQINSLYDTGHRILFMTARGRGSGIDWTALTSSQLKEWGALHHELIMGAKPSADLFIDDKCINIKDWEQQECRKVGFVAGCFDLIHAGYIDMFEDSKRHCSHLIVGLQIDPTCERPEKRKPIQSIEDRHQILKSIRHIDEIKIYETEAELYNLLETSNIDVRILGSDYKNQRYTGEDLGLDIYFHPRDHNRSTTNLKKQIATQWEKKS